MIARSQQIAVTVKHTAVPRTMLALLLLFGCLYAGYTAFYKGYANAWYYQAEFAINAWAKQGKVTSRSEYDSALAAINKAHALDPSYPHYAHINGRILHWGIISGFEGEAKYTTVRSLYLAAVARRPMWPDVWLDLATINNYLNGYNADTQQYLAKAMATGPYINAVIAGSVRILLSNWSELTGQDKQLVFDQFGKSVKQQALLIDILTYATSIDKQKLLCVQLKFNPAYRAVKSTSAYTRYCK
ncbi:VpsP family polysaccharide biosynthesis protein [Moritella sp.]|uniref:VpsP family polysaccharide biosynthesis protein n=1 Tax=Moritella sp. TaxID=78556 RepID=UPI001E1118BF|nr:VpsP family polysaccharide biosynthesis protein [Moritella sp.]MCJ8349704.1 VpsP family polysaccharide biosynthesis protein [Moritella sp.]NQZ39879.1 hypothetical protein [Moritella sp.]